MKRLAYAFLLSSVATGAFAADAVVYEEPAPVEVTFFSWTGGYVGLHAGYALCRTISLQQQAEFRDPRTESADRGRLLE